MPGIHSPQALAGAVQPQRDAVGQKHIARLRVEQVQPLVIGLHHGVRIGGVALGAVVQADVEPALRRVSIRVWRQVVVDVVLVALAREPGVQRMRKGQQPRVVRGGWRGRLGLLQLRLSHVAVGGPGLQDVLRPHGKDVAHAGAFRKRLFQQKMILMHAKRTAPALRGADS
ncbi:MAG: hypothetical protein IPG77_21065 [Betaproteobacteria bacterium]|jgi:hypothetical protein|nr:hypothetical protein [Betaproteobacteria bacterium]